MGRLSDALAAGTYEFQSDYAKRLMAEGFAKGFAEEFAKGMGNAIVRILDTRGIPASDDVRRRVYDCTDPDRLERWLDRAITADTAEEIFD